MITSKILGMKHEMILVRVYGHNSELMIDRKSEIRNMRLLHANDCGSELYASFKNGLAYQFLPGATLDLETVVDPCIYPLIARACAKMHSIKCKGKSLCANTSNITGISLGISLLKPETYYF